MTGFSTKSALINLSFLVSVRRIRRESCWCRYSAQGLGRLRVGPRGCSGLRVEPSETRNRRHDKGLAIRETDDNTGESTDIVPDNDDRRPYQIMNSADTRCKASHLAGHCAHLLGINELPDSEHLLKEDSRLARAADRVEKSTVPA